MTRSVIEKTITSANGFGLWSAKVVFTHTLSESDPRREFNIQAQLSNIRRAARKAIINELVAREQTTNETEASARARVGKSLGRLEVTASDVDAMNCWHSITLGEPTTPDKMETVAELRRRSELVITLLKGMRTSMTRGSCLALAIQNHRRIDNLGKENPRAVSAILSTNAELYDLVDAGVIDPVLRKQLTTEISDFGSQLERMGQQYRTLAASTTPEKGTHLR